MSVPLKSLINLFWYETSHLGIGASLYFFIVEWISSFSLFKGDGEFTNMKYFHFIKLPINENVLDLPVEIL